MRQLPNVRERQDNKIAATNITNEITRALREIAPQMRSGQVEEPFSPSPDVLPVPTAKWQVVTVVMFNSTTDYEWGADYVRATAG